VLLIRRDNQRSHRHRRATHSWHTFGDRPLERGHVEGFGALSALDEYRLAKGAGVPHHGGRDAEILTYVHEGAIAFEDPAGRSGVLQAGEFQRFSVKLREHSRETNASDTEPAHVFQIDLRPSRASLLPGQEHKRFSAAQRKRDLCTVASPDGRGGSLRMEQDTYLYSVLLSKGQHVAHELLLERTAWLHVVEGEVQVGDVVLTTGDGAGFSAEPVVSITALRECELLIVDLPRARGAPLH